MSDVIASPLHAEHVALGASLTPFAGWDMPLRYTSDLAEHTAVRTAAGLFDLSHMGEIEVSGPQAARALDTALVGNLGALRLHGARYTMICAPDGGVLDDLIAYRLGETEYLVVANAANHDTVVAALRERTAGLDVVVDDASRRTALVAVQGPRAVEILAATPGLTGSDELAAMKYYACLPVEFGGVPVLAARTGYTGEDGFELFVDAEHAVPLWRALLEAGRPFGLVPAGLAARDSLRLEAGMPLYGHELDTSTTPFDAGLGRVVRFDKVDEDGAALDFVGRSALAERAEQPATRTLVGLAGLSRRAGRPGHPVVRADGTVVGEVTSGAPSPTLGHPIAMAYVLPEDAEPGGELGVDVRGRVEPVRVVALPFYRRSEG